MVFDGFDEAGQLRWRNLDDREIAELREWTEEGGDEADLFPESVLKRIDDEGTRLKYESCPGCGTDLGAAIHGLEVCPNCGEEIDPE